MALQTLLPTLGAGRRRSGGGVSRDQLVYGTYLPDASTTGLLSDPAGFTVINANTTITVAGTTYTNTWFKGRVDVRAANVSLSNCRITGDALTPSSDTGLVMCNQASCVNFSIVDCEIYSAVPNHWWTGITGHDFTAERFDIYWSVGGFQLSNTTTPAGPYNVCIYGCYVQDLSFFSPDSTHTDNKSHNDCLQIFGGSGGIALGNRFDSYLSTTTGDQSYAGDGTNPPDANFVANHPQALSCVQINVLSSQGPTNYSITDNWMRGGEIGVNEGDAGIPANTNFGSVLRNRFDHEQYLQGGGTFWTAGDHSGNTNTWTINVTTDLVINTGQGTPDRNYYQDTLANITVRGGASPTSIPPVVRAAASANTGATSQTAVAVTVPTTGPGGTVVAGDRALVVVAAERSLIPSLPAGWTSIDGAASGSATMAWRFAWKNLVSGDIGASVSSTVTTARRMAMAVIVFGNALDPIATAATFTQNGAGTATATLPNATPAGADAMLASVLVAISSLSPFARTFTPAATWTEQAENGSTSTSSSNAFVHVDVKAITGSAGVLQTGDTVTCAEGGAYGWMGWSVVIPKA